MIKLAATNINTCNAIFCTTREIRYRLAKILPRVTIVYVTAGAGAGEGISNQRVNVDDGSEAVGALDQLVYQTIHFSLYFSLHCSTPSQGGCQCRIKFCCLSACWERCGTSPSKHLLSNN